MSGNRYYRGPPSDHFDGRRFFNPHHPGTDRSLAELLRWQRSGARQAWPKQVPGRRVVPATRVDGLSVTMVGHATVLIQVAGRNLLVDPVWAERASPVRWAGPRRVNAPGIDFERLPTIDVVLLTHNHYDHLDLATLRRLWHRDRPRVVAPLGNEVTLAHAAKDLRVEALDWRQSLDLGAGSTVWLHPANHWSSRTPFDRRMALWGGFVVETPAATVYDSGDTGYGDGRIFRELKERYPSIDLAILPIGAYAPRWFMAAQHIDPAEAVQVLLDCGAAQAIGVHWGTFQLTDEARTAPRDALADELERRGLPGSRFAALEPGDTWVGGAEV